MASSRSAAVARLVLGGGFVFMGWSFSLGGWGRSRHRIGLGRPAFFSPAAALAVLCMAGSVCTQLSYLATRGRWAGGGVFHSFVG
jgi:hypothetical protein